MAGKANRANGGVLSWKPCAKRVKSPLSWFQSWFWRLRQSYFTGENGRKLSASWSEAHWRHSTRSLGSGGLGSCTRVRRHQWKGRRRAWGRRRGTTTYI